MLSRDAQLIILGAVLGGVFSLLIAFAGALFKDWLSARRKRIEHKEELMGRSWWKKALYDSIQRDIDKPPE